VVRTDEAVLAPQTIGENHHDLRDQKTHPPYLEQISRSTTPRGFIVRDATGQALGYFWRDLLPKCIRMQIAGAICDLI
jgi:hypothetical protein